MSAQSQDPPASRARRPAWFAGPWAAGVLAVGLLAWIIRLANGA